jgi:hypothetical protein
MLNPEQEKPRFSIFRVLVALGVVFLSFYAISEGFLIAWRHVVVRKATPDDEIARRYFGFEVEKVDEVRNIAVAEGTFSKNTWLSAWLYLVRSGNVEQVSGFTVGRSPNRVGEAKWINMRIALALAETKQEGGRITQLGSAGQTRGEGGIGEIVQNISVIEKQTFPGRLWTGRKYLLHVEGDRKFEARRDMTVEDFAKANAGNFFVVAVELD